MDVGYEKVVLYPTPKTKNKIKKINTKNIKMKKQLQTRIEQDSKRKIYNTLDARVYRICTRPTLLEDFKKGVGSFVSTPLGEYVPIVVKFSEREITMSFRHNDNNVTEKITLPSDNYGIFYGLGRSSCGKFSWCVRKYNARKSSINNTKKILHRQ